MDTPRHGIENALDDSFTRLVQPLMQRLGLQLDRKSVDNTGALYLLSGERLKVRLVNDRGVLDLEIAPHQHPEDFWDLQLIETLLTPAPSENEWPIPAIDQQVERLRNSWPELNEMFSPAHFERTRARLESLGAERFRRLMKPNAV